MPIFRTAPANLFTTNLTVGEPWTLTVSFDNSGWNSTKTWPCQLSTLTPWEPGVDARDSGGLSGCSVSFCV